MNTWQYAIYKKAAEVRDKILLPLNTVFAAFHISPNMLTGLGLISMLLYLAVIKTNLVFALVFIIIAYAFDVFDGSLARHLKVDNDKGKFIDNSADGLKTIIFLVGLVMAELTDPISGMLFVAFFVSSKSFRTIILSKRFKSDWLFFQTAGLWPNLLAQLLYLFFIFTTITTINVFHIVIPLFAAFLILDTFIYFGKLLRTNRRKK